MSAIRCWAAGFAAAALGAAAAARADAPELVPGMFEAAWMQARARMLQERSAAAAELSAVQAAALDRLLREAEREIEDARRVQNITAIRVAQSYRDLLAAARAEVEAGRPLEWPEGVRREVQVRLRAANETLEAEQRPHDERMERLRVEQMSRFASALRAAGLPAPDPLDDYFEAWLTADPAAPSRSAAPLPGPEPDDPPPEEEPPETEETPEPVEVVIAQSGEPVGPWIPVGRWTAEMTNPDIMRVPVFGRARDQQGRHSNPVIGGTSTWAWEALQAIEDEGEYAFRLKRIEDHEPVDLLEWPGSRNAQALLVRTPFSTVVPVKVGFELQVSRLSEPQAPEREQAPEPSEIEVPVFSRPPGAEIRVNGSLHRLPNGEPARTPARIRLRPGTARIELALEDHLPHAIPEFRVAPGAVIQWRFQHETELPGRPVRVGARPVWENSLIEVRPGDRVWVIPEESAPWVVGAGGEPCGAAGYPENRFPQYASERDAPRQIPEAPYGALIARIGPRGRPFPVAGRARWVAESAGFLFFDVNESVDPLYRRDNRGVLELRVIVVPSS